MVHLIAVIDNDDPFLALMRDLFVDEGYRVVVGLVAKDALALIETQRPSLVILDIRMEDKDSGLRILRALRADARFARLPVILCSADNRFLALHDAELRRLGAMTLEKPFEIETLTRLVRVMLEEAQPRDATG